MERAISRSQAASLALQVFLNNHSVDQILDAMVTVRNAWRDEDPNCSLEDNPALILLTGVMLNRTTGIFLLTEETAAIWLEACQAIADSGSKSSS